VPRTTTTTIQNSLMKSKSKIKSKAQYCHCELFTKAREISIWDRAWSRCIIAGSASSLFTMENFEYDGRIVDDFTGRDNEEPIIESKNYNISKAYVIFYKASN
jgi:hypothetical protein